MMSAVLAALCLVASVSVAQLNCVYPNTVVLAETRTNWQNLDVVVPKFDSTLGSLYGIEFDVNYFGNCNFTYGFNSRGRLDTSVLTPSLTASYFALAYPASEIIPGDFNLLDTEYDRNFPQQIAYDESQPSLCPQVNGQPACDIDVEFQFGGSSSSEVTDMYSLGNFTGSAGQTIAIGAAAAGAAVAVVSPSSGGGVVGTVALGAKVTVNYLYTTTATVCPTVCAASQFSNAGVCTACTVCGVNEFISQACTATTDTVCSACGGGCPAGEGTNFGGGHPCTSTSNALCGECDLGFWNNGLYLQCQPCTVCGSNQWTSTACTANNDAVCSACTVCGVNEFISQACTATTDTVCSACGGGCPVGEGTNFGGGHPCTSTSNALCGECGLGFWNNGLYLQCQPCTVCGSNQWTSTACSANNDAVCSACTACTATQYASPACGGSQNAVCHACTKTCPIGKGANGAGGSLCSATADRVCGACDVGTYQPGTKLSCQACSPKCGVGLGTNAAGGSDCTADANRVCSPCDTDTFNTGAGLTCGACSSCSAGTYPSASCTAAKDTVCKTCSAKCGAGTGANGSGGAVCTTTSNTVCGTCAANTYNTGSQLDCQTCGSCTATQYISAPCAAASDTVCKACSTKCGAGTGINAGAGMPCTSDQNVVCDPCDANTFNTGAKLTCTACTTACPRHKGINGVGGSACTSTANIVCTACPAGTTNSGTSLTCS